MPFRHHRPLDNSVVELDREVLPYGASHWVDTMESEMAWRPVEELQRAYPELVFTTVVMANGDTPKGRHVAKVNRGKRVWLFADWRQVGKPVEAQTLRRAA